MYVIQNRYPDLKPCKIVLQRIKETKDDSLKINWKKPDVNFKLRSCRTKSHRNNLSEIKREVVEGCLISNRNTEDVCEERWNSQNDSQNPSKINFSEIKEEIEEGSIELEKIVEDDSEKKWHNQYDLQKPRKILFPKLKKEINEDHMWDGSCSEVVASSSEYTPNRESYFPSQCLGEEIVEEAEIPISEEHFDFKKDYEENGACTSDPLATESVKAAEWQQDLLQDADIPRHTSDLDKKTKLVNESTEKYLFFCSRCPVWTSNERVMKEHNLKHAQIDFLQENKVHEHGLIHKKKQCTSFDSPDILSFDCEESRPSEDSSSKSPSCSLCLGKLPHKRKVGRPRKNAPLVCPGQFSQKLNISTPPKDAFECSVCSATFSHKRYLSRHMVKHSGEKSKLFQCSLCPAKFSVRSHLAGHFLCHSSEKPFACTMCPAKFTLKSYLTVHILSHSGEKPFVCPKCPAKFAMKWNLKKHMIVHQVLSQKLNLKARIMNHMI